MHDLAWLVAGDFHQLSSSSELSGGAPVSHSRCQKLHTFLDSSFFFDFGALIHKPQTFCKIRDSLARIREPIDKV